LDDEIQGDDKFQVNDGQILINSRPNTIRQKYLKVEVSKKFVIKKTKKNKKSCDSFEEVKLFEMEIPYVKHSEYKTFSSNKMYQFLL
jgi:hypothetical protein